METSLARFGPMQEWTAANPTALEELDLGRGVTGQILVEVLKPSDLVPRPLDENRVSESQRLVQRQQSGSAPEAPRFLARSDR